MKKLAALMFLVFISFLQCTNNTPLPNGYDLLEREGKVGLVPPVTFTPTTTARFWRAVPTGSKSTLLLGAGQDAQSYIIFQNRNLSNVSADATVISATLSLYSADHFGDDMPFTITAHRVERSWDENDIVWSDIENGYRTEILESWDFTPGDTTWHTFSFSDLNFISDWIDDSQQDVLSINGLLLKFDQASSGTIFYASEASSFTPYMQIISQDTDGNLDTTNTYLTHDASLFHTTNGVMENELEENPDVLLVGDGTGYRSLLQFDFSEIPAEATIHKAELKFLVDSENVFNSDADTDGTFSVSIGAADSLADWQGKSFVDSLVTIDSKYSPGVDVASGVSESFVFDSPAAAVAVTRIVQRWVSGVSANKGFLIYAYYQGIDFQEMAFKSGSLDPSAMPTIEVTYSLPAAHRFAQ